METSLRSPTGRIWVTLLGAPVAGGFGFFVSKVVDRWGVLDGPANSLGDFLKANVSGSDLGIVLGCLVFFLLYGVLVYFVWRRSDSKPPRAKGSAPSAKAMANKPKSAEEGIVWQWEHDGSQTFWLGVSRSGFEPVMVRSFQMHGTNFGASISDVSGFIRSDLTGQEFPIFLIVDGDLVAPSDTYGIPSGAEFGITAPFGSSDPSFPGINADEFLTSFGAFTAVVNFDGESWSQSFSVEDVEDQIQRFSKVTRQGAEIPKVTKRKEHFDGPKG